MLRGKSKNVRICRTIFEKKYNIDVFLQKDVNSLLLYDINKNHLDKNGIIVAKKYPNSESIQSQLMTIYIKIGQYEEALKIADDNYNYEPIQNQLITLYMRMGKYDEAEKEAQKHLDCDPNQSQLMTIYIEQI